MSATASITSASTSTAVELLAALRTVVKGLERMPIPVDPARAEAWSPAPRHVAALMQVVADEGMSVSTLAARLEVSLATASQLVTDLDERGIVERFPDPADRRRTLLRVADTHRELADTLLDTRLRPVQRALDRMRPAEQRALVRGLELVAEELGIQHS
ncbi:MAG: MarR family transcriptional regulator [Frankiaceae bacterium]|nr:MarR family transcriptional regulator [Frankiaceae bacterium]MBV9872847.1 MarR family transcriptional regulator [Frankiaceae bacterium]